MDATARLVRPRMIAYSQPHDIVIDLWRELSAETREILDRETDAKGRRLQVHSIGEPDPRGLVKSDRDELSACHVHF
jgi:agmatine deiminase